MMLELKDSYLKLIQQLERENCCNYKISQVGDHYYINVDELFNVIDDTQYSRQYAEEKLQDIIDREKENYNSLQMSTMTANKELIAENETLKEQLEAIRNTLNEDDYDRLREEGITYYEEYDC